jgi:hypothetical protein
LIEQALLQLACSTLTLLENPNHNRRVLMDVADPVSYVAISSTLAVLSALLQEQVFFDSKACSHLECPPNHSHGAPVSCSIKKLRTLMNARCDNGRRREDALLLFAYYKQFFTLEIQEICSMQAPLYVPLYTRYFTACDIISETGAIRGVKYVTVKIS